MTDSYEELTRPKPVTWKVVVKEYGDNDSSAGETSEEEEEEQRVRDQLFFPGDIPSEYWHVQKLVKYMKTVFATMVESAEEVGKGATWQVVIKEYGDNDSSAGETSEEEGEEGRVRDQLYTTCEITSDYWHVQKLVKYMKTGNTTGVNCALCLLQDYDTTRDLIQMAILDIGGIEVLVNLLEANDFYCKLGSLILLRTLSANRMIRRVIGDLGGVPALVANMCDPARDLQIYAAETLANVVKIRRSRRTLCLIGGIPKVIHLLDAPESCLNTPWAELDGDNQEIVTIVIAAARVLFAASVSRKNKEVMRRSGIVFLIKKLIHSVHLDIVEPIVGAIQNCLTEKNFQLAIETENLVGGIVDHLKTAERQNLQKYSAAAIFKCAENPLTNEMISKAGGIEPLVSLARNTELQKDKALLASVTGAIWKCATFKANMVQFDVLNTTTALVSLLHDEHEEVLTNVMGALSECVKYEGNRIQFRISGGIPLVVNLLNHTHIPLLENVPLVMNEIANEERSMREIEELDGVRLVWSLLKNKHPQVQSNAAWALVPLIENALDSGELVRSFVGSFEVIVALLKTGDRSVLPAVCAALATISKDLENLAILTDHGIIPVYTKLVHTTDLKLREQLSTAIAYACAWHTNCKELGRLGAITPLVTYIADWNHPEVQRCAALALFHLSKNAFNCITMHESGVVPFLLKACSSPDKVMQDSAAGCMKNMRELLIEAEAYHLIHKGFPKVENPSSDEVSFVC